MASKKPRVSLTKAQIQAGIGAELLALCQTVTADGKLQLEEIKALRNWLRANQKSDLPSIGFLVETVSRIIADKIVAREEQRELYKALETILPKEARTVAVGARKAVEASKKTKMRELKANAKEQERARKQAEREHRARNRPLWSQNFMVAGVHYDGRPQIIEEHVDTGEVFMVREHKNRYSKNAIAIHIQGGMMIGYVPEYYAKLAAPLLDQGHRHSAYVVKILDGGRVPIPIVEAAIYRPDADMDYRWAPNFFSW